MSEGGGWRGCAHLKNQVKSRRVNKQLCGAQGVGALRGREDRKEGRRVTGLGRARGGWGGS